MCSKFQLDSVGLNSCFVDHADGSSQFCLFTREEEWSKELSSTKCNKKTCNLLIYKNLVIKNVTAVVRRFINNLKSSLNREEKNVERYVTIEEYSKAEHLC